MTEQINTIDYDLIIIGGGAAGFFAAINYAGKKPQNKVLIIEKSTKLLSKVKVSGGGRCNVTKACFEARELVKNYPRGEKELLGPFSRFGPADTMQWFEDRGVPLKVEDDDRVFPVSNDSSDIVNCLLNEAKKYGVEIITSTIVSRAHKTGKGFDIECSSGEKYTCSYLLAACGGSANPDAYKWIVGFGHSIAPPVPSLFTFNLPGEKIIKLMGVSCQDAQVSIKGAKLSARGPVLITHWGLSGPAVLKLSAFAARILFEMNYTYSVLVNWAPDQSHELLLKVTAGEKRISPAKYLVSKPLFNLPKRLWEFLLLKAGISEIVKWADVSNKQLENLHGILLKDEYKAKGKTTFKEEFVTCGGVERKEVDFKTMQSKVCPGLFFAGEVLDIDGVTGGFNFQNAWTGAWIAAEEMGG